MVWNRATNADSQWSRPCLGDVRSTLHNPERLHGASGCSHRWSKYFHHTNTDTHAHTQIKASLLRLACFQNKKLLIVIIFLVYCWLVLPGFFLFFLGGGYTFSFFSTGIDRERKEWPTVIFLFVLRVRGMTQDTWHVCREIHTSAEAKFNWFKPSRPELQRSSIFWKVGKCLARPAWAAFPSRLLDSLCGVAVLGFG